MQGGSGLSLEEIVQFDWQVALGDQTLTLQELEALARLKAPLVQGARPVGAGQRRGDPGGPRLLEEARARPRPRVREVVQMALGGAGAAGGLAVGGVTADGLGRATCSASWRARPTFEELPPPAGFHGTLRPYQVRGYSWLAFLRRWGLGACLADDMGLGKTVQTLALLQRDWEAGDRRPALLICPMSVVGNWKKEAERFTPDLPVLVHHG